MRRDRGELRFADRREAGSRLGAALAGRVPAGAVVVGLARGGVVVAAEVARTLGATLDALAVRKVGHPLEPEYALGAVAPAGEPYVRSHDGLREEELAAAVAAARARAEELDRVLHERARPVPVAGRTTVLVDDGLATGATMTAACRWARSAGASRVVVAVPVGAAATVAALSAEADEVVALHAIEHFGAVGFWYTRFDQVETAEVLDLLAEAAARAG